MSRHYDVVVLGASVGALAAAALLARRSWRVLVLGQGRRAPMYQYEGMSLARRSFTMHAHASPAWGRILVELAQSQTFRRRMLPLDPMFQILSPSLRFNVPPYEGPFGREVDREFPEVRRVVDQLYVELARTNALADLAFERDVVWPPGGFWERRETERVASSLPHIDASSESPYDFLAEFPRDHDYRAVLDVPAQFATDLAADLPPFALARLHGAWTRGLVHLGGGEEELTEFLLERIRAHGGETRLGDSASEIVHRGGKVTGIRVDGDEGSLGVAFVVSDLRAVELLQLAQGFAPSRRALASMPRVVPKGGRFVVSAIVRNEGIPAPLARESFLLPKSPLAKDDPVCPRVHLQCLRDASGIPGTTLLVAEALLEDEGVQPIPLARAREAVLKTVQQFLPFVERHYVVVDSPHDGRSLWEFLQTGKRVSVDRARLRSTGGCLEAEPMLPRWRVTPSSFYGLAGEPVRTPLGGAFTVGRTTLPALGQEGEFLAAWSVARIITRTDRRREKMHRDMWTKVELG